MLSCLSFSLLAKELKATKETIRQGSRRQCFVKLSFQSFRNYMY